MRKFVFLFAGFVLVLIIVLRSRRDWPVPASDHSQAHAARAARSDTSDPRGAISGAQTRVPAAGSPPATTATQAGKNIDTVGAAPNASFLAATSLSPNVVKQIEALQAAKIARRPAEQKLVSQLMQAEKMRRGEPIADGVPTLRVDLDKDGKGRVLTDINAKVSEELLQRIAAVGGEVVNHFTQFDAIRAWIPLSEVEALAERGDVKFIRRAEKFQTNVGSVSSEGDTVHAAATARTQFSVNGAGVKIGVLSDSVDHLAAAQGSGDLGTVTVLSDRSGVPAPGEGTAMLEIVHDIAPGAELFFATAKGGPAAFAQNIRDLRFQNRCDIIIDDITYGGESPFQDGVIALAVNAVIADGALFFSSAANSGNKNDNTSCTWEGDFVDGGSFSIQGQVQGRIHSFGSATHNTSTKGGSFASLYWADPLGASTNDYDFYLTDAAGNSIIAAGQDTQNGTQDPVEFLDKVNDNERILIVKFKGDARYLHVQSSRGRLQFSTSGSTRGHNAARDAFTVAAVDVSTSFPDAFVGNTKNPVEDFSSDGLRRVFFNPDGTPITPGNFSSTGGTVWQKPDIAAADGGQTSVPGFKPFFGTSAAAPHAGAIAALLKSYNPALTPAQIRAILTSTALDIEAAGVDRDSGHGIVMPLLALQAAPGAEQPTITSFAPISGGVGVNVTLTGTKLNGATAVRFNGVSATFAVDSSTRISTIVPAGATTGRITLTTPAGTATSAADFTVQATPAITGFTPSSGAIGATVVLAGVNLNGATAVRFNGVNAPGFTVNSGTQITVTVPTGATSGRISVATPAGTATSADVFNVTAQPSIAGFTPATGGASTSVLIDGANFTGATAVRFNGVNAPGFTVNSSVRITVAVPPAASSGPISVVTPDGTATSANNFTVVPVPSISSFTPSSAAVGASVALSGANFTGATAVRFNGVNAVFTINSAARIETTVPAGATTGTLSVTTPGGTANSAATFTVIAPPSNDSFANAQSISGNSGTASGNNIAATKEAGEPDHAANPGGRSVWYRWTAPSAGAWQFSTIDSSFDTLLAVYTGASVGALTLVASGDDTAGGTNSHLTFVASSGTVYHIAVDGFRAAGGTATDVRSGNIVLNWATTTAPIVSGFSPSTGAPGANVTISGANFTGVTAVRFNGATATFDVNSAAQITAAVPAAATTGPIEVVKPNGSARSAINFAVVNPPANDQFANAQTISGNSGSISGRNTDASKQANEPDHAGNPGGHSIWYSWAAPGNGRWTFDTVGSSFDTLLAIYSGTALPSLSLAGSNDDSSPGTISRVAFTATAGTVYRIAIDGRGSDSGNTILNWAFTPNPPSITSFAPSSGGVGSTVVLAGINFSGATSVRLNGVLAPVFSVVSPTQITFTVPEGVNSGPISVTTPNGAALSAESFTVTSGPSNDQFADAVALNGIATIVAGQNVTATKENGEPSHAGDSGGRSVWYRWTAPSSGTWALDTAGSSFDTMVAVYLGSAVNALTVIASNDDTRAARTSRLTFAATVGTTYRIAVDGWGGDNGNFLLKLLPTLAPQIIYETGFETTQGFSAGSFLGGQNGWTQTGSGGNAVAAGLFEDFGQQAYIGAVAPSFGQENVFLWQPLNFTPQTETRPVVRFSVLMAIVDSTSFDYDNFDWSVFNIAGERLFTLNFDNTDLNIYYRLDDNTGFHLTGATFENGPIYELVISMDFARGRWSATLDGEALVNELPITTTGAALTLGDIDAVWFISDAFFPGDNAMVFDEYRVAAEPSDLPAVVLAPQNQSVTVGSTVRFVVVASGGEPLQYQWHFNGAPLPGETGALLTLNNVSLGQTGNYSVTISNLFGGVSRSAMLSVNQPGPVNLLAGSRLPDGRFQFSARGTAGSRVVIEFSSDMVQWQDLTIVVLTSERFTLNDPDAGAQTQRFYRARIQP